MSSLIEFLPQTSEGCGKVLLLVMSVILSTGGAILRVYPHRTKAKKKAKINYYIDSLMAPGSIGAKAKAKAILLERNTLQTKRKQKSLSLSLGLRWP